MRGHLGFKCRPCARAAAPVVTAIADNQISWTEPNSYGREIAGYAIEAEFTDIDGGFLYPWYIYATVAASPRTYTTYWCRQTVNLRVRAITSCGVGSASNVVPTYPFFPNASSQSYLLTSSGQMGGPDCDVHSVAVYCIGRGSLAPSQFVGGNGGGLAYKVWQYATRNSLQAWSPAGVISYTITNSQSSVTFDGVTIWADAATTSAPGGYGSSAGFSAVSGYGGSYGVSGNLSNPPQTSSAYMYGGSIGGGVSPPALVSPCQRMPAVDRFGLMASVSLAGGKVTEDCSSQAAFGSGASRFPYPAYGASAIDYTAGYGGGGFDSSNPPGAGCVIIRFNPYGI